MGFMHGRLLGVIRARRYYSLPLPPQRTNSQTPQIPDLLPQYEQGQIQRNC